MKKILFFTVIICVLASCKSREQKDEERSYDEVLIVESPAEEWGNLAIKEYEGIVPTTDSTSVRYKLSMNKREHQPSGNYVLISTFMDERVAKDQTFISRGKFHILRGSAENDNATVYKLVDELDDQTNYFMNAGNGRLRVLNDRLEDPYKNSGPYSDIVLIELE